jgi:hypothetical protein
MLERILIRHCIQENIALSSFEASDAATALVELFRRGVHDERQLGKILAPRASYARRLGASNRRLRLTRLVV